jgi:hypothetical protein
VLIRVSFRHTERYITEAKKLFNAARCDRHRPGAYCADDVTRRGNYLNPGQEGSMKTRSSSSMIAAAVFACATAHLAAQSPVPAPQSTETVISVTGCVELTEQSPVGTSGAVGSLAGDTLDTTFILTNASVAGADPAPATARPSTYRIDNTAESALWRHVGHRVEVSGAIAPGTAGAAFPKLSVQSVRLVSAGCAG